MYRKPLSLMILSVCLVLASATALAAPVQLHGVQFPEKRTVELEFTATPIAPMATVTADVTYRHGQARIEIDYFKMKPAILFGGDVTCFVLWAVTRDGQIENLGEFMTRKKRDHIEFATGKKNFALMVTAETYYLVSRPSDLVAFYNRKVHATEAPTATFTFNEFEPSPRHGMDGIAHIIWDSDVPLDLLQARKAYEIATKIDAQRYADRVFLEAGAMLRSANATAQTAPKSRELLDFSRRAVALSNEAINLSMHRIEALELERELAHRRTETARLERRAAEAEKAAKAAGVAAEEARLRIEGARSEAVALRDEKVRLQLAMDEMNREKVALEAESERLRVERSRFASESERLRQEKAAANARLQSALSHVADTQESVRGFVINLPDILFDVDEATLKPEAQLVLAKLAGILLIMPEQAAIIEGHTDSTGDPGYNLNLSQRRADAVLYFMQSQGLDTRRLNAIGFGMQQPVADNVTLEGRRKNRRVEIVISDTTSTRASN